MHINVRKLKIKIKHLALEPAIIKKEERKLIDEAKWNREKQDEERANEVYWSYHSLMHHRKFSLRPHSRATQLVYAFLRNKKYSETEMPGSKPLYFNDLETIVGMIDRYDVGKIQVPYGVTTADRKKIIQKEFVKWLEEGEGA